MIGRTLAHYEVLDLLGKGGMGEVYRARDTKLEREVALKVLPESVSQDPERMARFQREARVLASLNHPNIAQIHGLEEADGQSFLIMELAEGEDLAQRLQGGAVGVELALDVARQIAEGLQEAHQRNVVHRDLKPANVKVSPDGRVKILDFGLARAFADEEDESADPSLSPTITAAMTQAGTILGTAAYMSPEQAKGRGVDQRTDIWALGVMLWEMLTGRQLFEAESVSETLACVLRVDPPWEELQNQPQELRSLMRRCLEKDPQRRFRDAADVALVLEDLRARLDSGAFESSHSLTMGRSSRTPTWVWGLIGLLGVACVGLALLWLARSPAPPTAPLRLSIQLPPDLYLIDSEPSLALSPDGTRLVYAARGASGQELYLRDLDDFEARTLPGSSDGGAASFSPDGKWIVFSSEKELRKLAVDGGSPITLAKADPWGATWTEDDQIVFTPSYAAGLSRVSASGGNVEVLTEPDSGRPEALFEVNHRLYWASRGYEESLDGTELLVVQTPPSPFPARSGSSRIGSRNWKPACPEPAGPA